MNRALYISAFVPDADGSHAGARVAHENLKRLRQQARHVDAVICTTERATPASTSEGLRVVRQTKRDLLVYLASHSGSLGLRSIVTAPIVHTRLNGRVEQIVGDLTRQHRYDKIFVDFTQALLAALRALRREDHDRVEFCAHDVFAQRLMRTPGLVAEIITGAVLREEQTLLAKVGAVLTLSAKDRDLVQTLYAIASVEVKPFEAPEWCSRVVRDPNSIDPDLLLFFGNFARHENSSAVEWFLRDSLDEIAAERTGTALLLVGTGSRELASRLGHPRVDATGFVADPSPYFARCALAIAPLLEGAGVKFKVLEALAAGVPVVGTPVACEGIDRSSPLLRCAAAAGFADAVKAALSGTDGQRA